MYRKITVLLSVLLVVGLIAGPASAKGKPAPKNGGTITLDQAAPSYGDTITFSVSTSKTDRPFVKLNCFQNGSRVYSSTVGMFQDWIDEWGTPDFTLQSMAWGGGDANCTAKLQYQTRRYKIRTLATLDFFVSG